MKRNKLIPIYLSLGVAVLAAGCSQSEPVETSVTETVVETEMAGAEKDNDQSIATMEDVVDALDPEYAFDLTQQLISFTSNNGLGYRTAGSEAEKQAARFLSEEYEKIGLTEVSMDEFNVDAWEFTNAELIVGDTTLTLGGYATQLVLDQELPLVYMNQGTAEDFLDQNVEGKLVLIDINQRSDWWINYPAYEAYLNGAKAVIAVTAGYGEGQDDLIVAQDICGPEYAPALSISKKDADFLKELLAKNNNEIMVKANINSTVTPDQPSYNVVGKIPGKDQDSYLFLGSHYDSYFHAFTDNTAAVAMNIAIAKAIIDSGYEPEKTIVIIAHGAEEWGISNSKYDWASGSYNQIYKVHPEWAQKGFAMINLDGVGYAGKEFEALCTDYEYVNILKQILVDIPLGTEVFREPVELDAPLTVMTDDFSYSISGIPSFKNNPRTKEFNTAYYHTQYDNTENFYHQEAYQYQHQFYTRLLLAFDQIAVMPVDFTTRFEGMEALANTEIFTQAGIDLDSWNSSLKNIKETSAEKQELVKQMNAGGMAAAEINKQLKEVFAFAQDSFVRLSWEDDNIFPYEQIQTNIAGLNGALEALAAGDIATALDEHLYSIDNNWYAYNFSKDTYRFFTDQVLTQSDDINQWGAGRVVGHLDLYDLISSLKSKEAGQDCSAEIGILEVALDQQLELLKETVEQQIKAINEMDQSLKAVKIN